VLWAKDGDGFEKIKIADFGFSKAFDESTLRTSCGSPNYVGNLALNPFNKLHDNSFIFILEQLQKF